MTARADYIRAWRAKRRPTIECSRCKSSFVRFGGQRYCTKECARLAEAERKRCVNGPGKHWARGKQYAPRKACEICARPFYAPPVLVRRGGGRFCSVSCRAAWQASNVPQPPGRGARRGVRKDFPGIYFKSSWEANWARYLNWQKSIGAIESWEYEPNSFPVNIDGQRRRYTPDFRVTSTEGIAYHEVKGVMDERSVAKIAAFYEQHAHLRLLVIDQHLYETVQWQLGVALRNWEADRVRNPHRVIRALTDREAA